jgi:hypothetical protein
MKLKKIYFITIVLLNKFKYEARNLVAEDYCVYIKFICKFDKKISLEVISFGIK